MACLARFDILERRGAASPCSSTPINNGSTNDATEAQAVSESHWLHFLAAFFFGLCKSNAIERARSARRLTCRSSNSNAASDSALASRTAELESPEMTSSRRDSAAESISMVPLSPKRTFRFASVTKRSRLKSSSMAFCFLLLARPTMPPLPTPPLFSSARFLAATQFSSASSSIRPCSTASLLWRDITQYNSCILFFSSSDRSAVDRIRGSLTTDMAS
mmetsp:Transcript_19847/g.43299  ORF Transcript_19847/g.43299 Transcript_19847/m.43299 type:complete len:219 (-) Transcript_19847:728-1384(-)